MESSGCSKALPCHSFDRVYRYRVAENVVESMNLGGIADRMPIRGCKDDVYAFRINIC